MTVAEIASSMETSRRTARDLLSDAATLEQSNRFARSFSLYFCAAEELAKFYLLEVAGRRVGQSEAFDWASFWKKLRSHDAKIVEAHVRLRNVEGGQGRADALALSGLGRTLINGCGTTDGPDWEIGLSATRALARQMMADADTLGYGAREIAETLTSTTRTRDLATVINTVVYTLEQVRQSACSKHDAIRYLDQIAGAQTAPGAGEPIAGRMLGAAVAGPRIEPPAERLSARPSADKPAATKPLSAAAAQAPIEAQNWRQWRAQRIWSQ